MFMLHAVDQAGLHICSQKQPKLFLKWWLIAKWDGVAIKQDGGNSKEKLKQHASEMVQMFKSWLVDIY